MHRSVGNISILFKEINLNFTHKHNFNSIKNQHLLKFKSCRQIYRHLLLCHSATKTEKETLNFKLVANISF